MKSALIKRRHILPREKILGPVARRHSILSILHELRFHFCSGHYRCIRVPLAAILQPQLYLLLRYRLDPSLRLPIVIPGVYFFKDLGSALEIEREGDAADAGEIPEILCRRQSALSDALDVADLLDSVLV